MINATFGMSDYKFIFLVYVGRSGSTYLAKQLTLHSNELLVFPETKLFDNLTLVDDNEFTSLTATEKLNLVKKDPRWENLDIHEGAIEDICKETTDKLDFIHRIVKHKCSQTNIQPKYVVVKNGASVWTYDRLTSLLGNILLLHVKRDPRGTTASRMRKTPIYKSKAGVRVEDSWFLAKFWNSYIDRVKALNSRGTTVIEVVYEDLIFKPSEVVSDVLKALSVEIRPGEHSSYKLSEIEKKSKHSNVQGPALESRTDAWKEELSQHDGIIVEKLCAGNLPYQFFSQDISPFRLYFVLIKGWVRHWTYNLLRIKEKLFT